ncbi:MAG: DUF1189 domain-containing protein [Lactobacillales bacterium]|nr:DUF1189 domain-containing protein [Lactobacillales bacterium]
MTNEEEKTWYNELSSKLLEWSVKEMHEINQLFLASFSHIEQLLNARKIGWGKTIFYGLFLTIILTLPITTDTWTTTTQVMDDVKTISKKVPDFSIKDGKLTPEKENEKGFIYQTNHIIFTFDPQGKRTEEDVENDATGEAASVAFLKDKFLLALPGPYDGGVVYVAKSLPVSYDSAALKTITGSQIRKAGTELQQPVWMFAIIYLMLFIPALWSFVINILILGLGALIYNKMSFLPIKFGESIKILVFASTAPIILTTLLSFVYPGLDTDFVQLGMTLLIYLKAVRPLRQPKV